MQSIEFSTDNHTDLQHMKKHANNGLRMKERN